MSRNTMAGSLMDAALNHTLSVYLAALVYKVSRSGTKPISKTARALTSVLLTVMRSDSLLTTGQLDSRLGTIFGLALGHG